MFIVFNYYYRQLTRLKEQYQDKEYSNNDTILLYYFQVTVTHQWGSLKRRCPSTRIT